MAEAPAAAKMITLKSSDEQTFVIEESVALHQRQYLGKEFVNVGNNIQLLFDLIVASNSLNTNGLAYLAKHKVWEMMSGKTPEQLRSTFNIGAYFTPEEDEQHRRENPWAFE
ncbi:SKP1-like protein 11 [Papaver somniferum]|uniref:SKP1-like protein 11 n=1 Tax=Papaver somniferum TaxID=3469 RepID=UPI000E70335B|nr:SKP1-like protein 11 [Papaver somniferum]